MTIPRTSTSHPLRVDWLPDRYPGRVGMTIAPGKKGPSLEGPSWQRNLDQDLDRLAHDEHVGVLVCLLEEHEFAVYGIGPLVEQAQRRGIEVLRLPLPDGGVPATEAEVATLVDTIKSRAEAGANVVIHCAGGLGRTGLVAGCFLVRCGVEPAQALQILRQVRQTNRIPETPQQKAFVQQWARRAREEAPMDLVATLLTQHPEAIAAATRAVLASRGRGERALVEQMETAVAADPAAAIVFDAAGHATVRGAGHCVSGGRFALYSLGALKHALPPRQVGTTPARRVRLSALLGTGPLTDIGALQALAGPATLFQVASQFNGLEAPGPYLVPIRDYFYDPTQGPRAAISAFPGVLVRHYAAPTATGECFVQSPTRQLDFLAQALPADVAQVRQGYLLHDGLTNVTRAAEALSDAFDAIQVGVHDNIQVVLGYDWDGRVDGDRRIAQVLTSTFAGGGYSGGVRLTGSLATLCRQLLRAAYLGTILAACLLGKRSVVLTLIGGGAFGNPHALIWDSVCWAVDAAEPHAPGTLDVVLNARGLNPDVRRMSVQQECIARGGVVIELT